MTQQLPPPPPLPLPPPPPAPAAPQPYRPAYGPGPAGFPGWAVGVMVGGAVVILGSIAAFLLIGPREEAPTVPPVAGTPLSPDTAGNPSPVESPPSTLRDLPPDTVGEFTLVTTEANPQFAQSLDAADAVASRYIRPDGTEVLHNVALYANETEASIGRRKLLGGFEKTGYVEVETNRSRGINVTRLSGPKEALVWSNGVILATVEGPPDVTSDFYRELPY